MSNNPSQTGQISASEDTILNWPIVAANWKMNVNPPDLDLVHAILQMAPHIKARIGLFPAATLLPKFAEPVQSQSLRNVFIGGQDCHVAKSGAFTGDISADLLKDAGAQWVILGHSERRQLRGETCSMVAAKVENAVTKDLTPLICVGETLEIRQSGRALEVVLKQLKDSLPDCLDKVAFCVSYEPVWAIGTGLSAEPDQVNEMLSAINDYLHQRFARHIKVPLLYGGSVTAHNAHDLMAIDALNGFLVGGASLKMESFSPILKAAHQRYA